MNVRGLLPASSGIGLHYELSFGGKQDKTVAICDWGGGSCEVSIIEVGDGVVEVQNVACDKMLGGNELDEAIVEYLIRRFPQGDRIKRDKVARNRLKRACEQAKIALTSLSTAHVNVPYILADANGLTDFKTDLHRIEFEQQAKPIFEQVKTLCHQALRDAGYAQEEIDELLLVGSSTRIPFVKQFLSELFSKAKVRKLSKEAVALGMAIRGGILAGEVKDVLLLDATPFSLGIETLGGVMTKVIERHSTIPTRKSQVFTTTEDNQTWANIHVIAGERAIARHNESVIRFIFDGIPKAPRGVPQIEITIDIDAKNSITITAQDKATGLEKRVSPGYRQGPNPFANQWGGNLAIIDPAANDVKDTVPPSNNLDDTVPL